MKIDEILNDDILTFLKKNLKWCLGFFIRYGFALLMGIIVFIFLYGNIKGGGFVSGAGVVIKKGKTINLTKVSEDTNEPEIKDIDDTILFLNDLKKKAGTKK